MMEESGVRRKEHEDWSAWATTSVSLGLLLLLCKANGWNSENAPRCKSLCLTHHQYTSKPKLRSSSIKSCESNPLGIISLWKACGWTFGVIYTYIHHWEHPSLIQEQTVYSRTLNQVHNHVLEPMCLSALGVKRVVREHASQ